MSIDALALLEDLIRCPSVTPTEAGVLEVLERVLVPLGFAVTRLRFEGDGSYPVDNLYATRGSGGRRLLFAGHTDVVPPGDAALWTHDPFAAQQADGKIFGRGAADMKSGVAAFIAAISRAVASGAADGGTIAVAITNDEEADSVNGTDKVLAWAVEQGHRFDFSIVAEPSAATSVGDRIKVGRRGSLSGRITVTGTQGHVAYPDRANNPLPVIASLVTALSDNTRLDAGSAHFQPSNLEVTSVDVGNETGNLIPAKGLIRFNIRFNDSWTAETLEAWIAQRIASVDARGCSIVYERHGRPSRSFLSPLGAPVALLDKVIAESTGQKPEHSTTGGTSDARFIVDYCPVVEFGLPGPTMHKADEHVAIADIEALTALYAAFIARYLQGEAR